MARGSYLTCLAALSFGAFSCFAQTAPAPPTAPERSAVVMRSTTRLVQLDVIVQDKNGKPIKDLTRDDFTLTDNGRPQTIALFSTQQGSVRADLTHTAETKAPNDPSIFSNRLQPSEQLPGSVTVILFDALNTSLSDQSFARGEILSFLHQLQPQDHVAIYLLTHRLAVISDFTQDSASLLQAIDRFQAYPSLLLQNSSQPFAVAEDTGFSDPKAAQHLANLINDMNSKLSDLSTVNRVKMTAQAMEAIANRVSGIPGRKNLIWVSGSFPVSIALTSNDNSPVDQQSQVFVTELERVARALNESNMAVYPVDARGLLVPSEFDASAAHPFSPKNTSPQLGVGQEEYGTMNLLADRTGGHAYFNTNDIKGAIRRTLSESHFTYFLGFYPDNAAWDGKFHELKLHLNESGLVVRYRKGYFALPDPPNTVDEARAALQAALWSPIDATGLGVSVKIQSIDENTRNLHLRVSLEGREIHFGDADGRHHGTIDAIYLQLDPQGALVAADPLTYTLDLAGTDYQRVLAHGYQLRASLVLRPSTKTLRVFVRDAVSGSLGSVTIPVSNVLPPQSPSTRQ